MGWLTLAAMRERVGLKRILSISTNVSDFNAVGNGVIDDSAAFQAAIDSLPAAGGKITIKDGPYLLNTTPSVGTKSIIWDIAPGVVFSGLGTGEGKFPYMSTNTAQMAVGPFIQSRSTQVSTHANGGVASFSAEMLQPASYVGQSVAIYAGASGSNASASANVWAINALVRANSGAGGTYQCMEVDVDCFSAAATVKGISITGAGNQNPDIGLEIMRSSGTVWDKGISLRNSTIGISIQPVSSVARGIEIGTVSTVSNVAIAAQQGANNSDTIFLQRNTDTSSTGYMLRVSNAANTSTLASIDAVGAGIFTGLSSNTSNNSVTTNLTLLNASNASSTSKGIKLALSGSDTISTIKEAVTFQVIPTDSNWTGGHFDIYTRRSDVLTKAGRITNSGSWVFGIAALSTSATDGFTYIPTVAGTPSGTPTSQTGTVAMHYDTTANKLWVYNTTWKSVTLA